ncbi:hypothetical protein [Lysinibacillus cavernae]|uniref:hypothetical protein n=1 Tax=Lysinibacillus cavernae TaxID=2666135 RepID=UPI0012D9792F|nr:hypothetical protein [Lysinibacillus cavernae]
MRRNQLSYFIYPFVYFIIRTINQWRKQEPITWGENVMMMIGTIIFIFIFIIMWNWAKKPYQWGKKTK